jgi:hypothetical protein
VLVALARVDALSAAVLCAASLALQAVTALTPILDGGKSQQEGKQHRQHPSSLLLLLAMAAPALALAWTLLHADDELLGAPSVASWWPDTGTWWYLMLTSFQGFQPYFRLVLAAHPFLYLAPMAVRLAGSKPRGGAAAGRRGEEVAATGVAVASASKGRLTSSSSHVTRMVRGIDKAGHAPERPIGVP